MTRNWEDSKTKVNDQILMANESKKKMALMKSPQMNLSTMREKHSNYAKANIREAIRSDQAYFYSSISKVKV